MSPSGSGFRVLEQRASPVSGSTEIVIYRLDPATLDFLEVLGHPEPLLGFPVSDWYRPRFWPGRVHPEDQDAVRAFFCVWAAEPRDEQLEYRVIDAAGRTVRVQQVIAVGRDAREQLAIHGLLMDITERFAPATQPGTALFPKSELFRILVEELAPPVRAISVYAEMLVRHLAAQHDDVGSDYAVGLHDELQRLDGTLGQLMRTAQNGGV